MGSHSEQGIHNSERTVVNTLMPVYNGISNYPEDMLVNSIQTSLDQSDKDIDVQPIVVLNGCTDNSLEVLKENFGNRLTYIISKYNVGMANAASMAASYATGDYFIIQSVRSWYEHGSLKKMCGVLEERPDIGFVYGNTKYHGELTHLHRPREFKKTNFYQNFNSLFGYMYRREAWDLGCRYTPFLYADGRWVDMADRDFQMQMIEYLNWGGHWIDETVLNYYYGGDQMTKRMTKYQRELDVIWKARWPKVTGGFYGSKVS